MLQPHAPASKHACCVQLSPHAPRRFDDGSTVAITTVVTDLDLVSHIFRGNIGPSTYVTAATVCKAWHSACRNDPRVLRSVALYQGGLTTTAFCGLFAIPWKSAIRHFPHEMRMRIRDGFEYRLFSDAAVDKVLDAVCEYDGIRGVRERLASRSRLRPCHPPPRAARRLVSLSQQQQQQQQHQRQQQRQQQFLRSPFGAKIRPRRARHEIEDYMHVTHVEKQRRTFVPSMQKVRN